MKLIRNRFLKSYNSLIVTLISLLGFTSSCDISGGGMMYGTPSADFIVKGKVEAAQTNSPIKGIQVVLSKEMDRENGKIELELDAFVSAVPEGSYQVGEKRAFPEDQTYRIKFTDIDGALNGEFETLDTTIVFKDPKFSGSKDSWYSGQAEKELNVKLKPKK